MSSQLKIWTVGHSNHDRERFLRLLELEQVEVIVDVRSYPYSRFAPHFNREELETAVRQRGMRYLFLGEELGGRPTREEHYDAEGHALYGPMSEGEPFVSAVNRLIGGASHYRIALMCSEGEPKHCHRRLLVGKVLTNQGIELLHILPDGSIRVELSVELCDDEGQDSLFRDEHTPWRSTQSVSRRRRLSASSSA